MPPSPRPELGLKEQLALWLIVKWLKGDGIMVNFKEFSVGDWLKLVANTTGAGAAGYAAGGYAGLAVGMITAIATILQSPPGKTSYQK